MANRSIPELTDNASPSVTDLAYMATRSHVGFYYDRKCLLSVLKKFVTLMRTTKKPTGYIVTSGECDKRYMSNQGATANTVFTLPLSVGELEIGFVIEENYKLTIVPNPIDRIMPTGVSIGVSIESSVQGSSVYLKGYAGGWLMVSQGGTWTASP